LLRVAKIGIVSPFIDENAFATSHHGLFKIREGCMGEDKTDICPMRTLQILCAALFLVGCNWNENMAKMDAARFQSDSIVDRLNSTELFALLPDSIGQQKGYQTLQQTLSESCNWEKRRGKFIDYYSVNQNGQRSIYFIYEYFLDCDSLRFLLHYDLEPKQPVLRSMNIQPLEQPCDFLVDPMKSILKDPKWDQKK
jgi:hypothetical protein